MANNISITGLGSGMDTASIVKALVSAQSAPLTRLTTQVSAVTTQKTTLSTLASQLSSLASKADALKSLGNLRSNTATTSDSSTVTVAVGGSARAGNFDVSVTALAASHRSYSNGFAAHDQGGLFGTGSVSFKVGSADAVSVDVTSSMTLDDVATAIDNIDGLDASVIYDGAKYSLQVSGTKTGAANQVVMSEVGTSFGLNAVANQRQSAADAQFTIDGIPMTRSTNLVDDAFAGVSLSLNKVTTSAAKIQVTADSSAMTSKITDMVNAYNTVVKTINAQASVVGANNSTKLTGDGTLAALQRSLQSMMSAQVGTGTFKSFAELGLATQRDGTMTLDSTKLNTALSTNRDAVANLVASNPSTSFVGLGEQLAKIAHSYGDSTGLIQSRVTAMGDRIRSMNAQADQMQVRIDAYEAQLNQRFASMESTVNSWKATSSSLSNGLKSST